MAFADDAGTFRTCQMNLTAAAQLPDGELKAYVLDCINDAQPSKNPVCAVIDRTAVDPEVFGGSYLQFPGAWLRIAPDRSTGGIVATADHLVLDGALFSTY